jgi:hypothetical protein
MDLIVISDSRNSSDFAEFRRFIDSMPAIAEMTEKAAAQESKGTGKHSK